MQHRQTQSIIAVLMENTDILDFYMQMLLLLWAPSYEYTIAMVTEHPAFHSYSQMEILST